MSDSYTTIVGNPPNIATNKADWDTWYDTLVAARLAEAPLSRSETYYFSQAGDDTFGDGSLNNPWQTLSKAQATIDAWVSTAGGMALLFRKGDEWLETTGLTLDEANITVSSYGGTVTDDKPFFNAFTLEYTSGWELVSGTIYKRTEANDIGWVRYRDNPFDFLAEASATALADGDFFWDGSELYVDIGADPTGTSLEAVISNSGSGVRISADGCRIQGIRADGWGLDRTNAQTQAMGVDMRFAGDIATGVIIDCESYYTGTHAIALNQPAPSGEGGQLLCMNCKAGGCKYHSAGETIFNDFSDEGDDEAIFDNCEARFGTLPSHDWSFSSQPKRGRGFFAHTDGVTTHNLVILKDCYVSAGNTYTCEDCDRLNHVPDTLDSIGSVRAFVVNMQQDVANGVGRGNSAGFDFATNDVIRYGCHYRMRPYSVSQLSANQTEGWLINCILELDMTNRTSTRTSFYNTASAANKPKIYNCFIYVNNLQVNFSIDYDVGGLINRSADAIMHNTIVQMEGTAGTYYVGINNDATKQKNNAYYGITDEANIRGYGNDPGKIELVKFVDNAEVTNAFYQTGNTDLLLDVDAMGKTRDTSNQTLGPFADPKEYLTNTGETIRNNKLAQIFGIYGAFEPTKASVHLRPVLQDVADYFDLSEEPSIDALNFNTRETGGSKVWATDSGTNFTGKGFLTVESNTTNDDYQLITFPVKAPAAGNYDIWIRGQQKLSGTFDASVYLDGVLMTSISKENFPSFVWNWYKTTVNINSVSQRTLGILLNTDGITLDKIYITPEHGVVIPALFGPDYTDSPYLTVHANLYRLDANDLPVNSLAINDYKSTLSEVREDGWYNFDLNFVSSSASVSFDDRHALVIYAAGSRDKNYVLWTRGDSDVYALLPSATESF